MAEADATHEQDERVWRTRLRWRLRGHTAAAVFVVVLAVETLLLTSLPVAGDGIDPAGAFLLAGFVNLGMVGLAGPIGALWLRRRRPDLPSFVARDRAGSAAMLALVVILLVGGLVRRPALADLERARVAQAEAVRSYVRVQAPAFEARVAAADTVELGGGLYRTCVPSEDPGRALCLFVATDQSPPGVTVDQDMRPNSVASGPDNPGRRSG